ncbi:helix-turn-helix domain-containing protein [Allorhizobium pseudoryzae]|uniref:helix-turn-helix domain-containing protein n=1 Tax=Allorhizobium pseudoryzae TaxID=379684 RepID=UPI003D064432
MASAKKTPVILHRFSTDMVENEHRFEAFRSRINTMFDMQDPDPDARRSFAGGIESVNMGAMLISSMRTQTFRFERPRQRLVRDFLDHILLRVDLAGPLDQNGRPAALTVLDLGRVSEGGMTPAHNVSVVFSRASLGPAAEDISRLHGESLTYPTAIFLADHILSLFRMGRNVEAETVPQELLSLTPTLVAACLDPQQISIRRARNDIDTMMLVRARDFIQSNLSSPMLTPDLVAREIGVSRATLYRLFDPAGGVARVIREARIKAAARSLTRAGADTRIGDIAHAFCFASDAHFSRAFKAQFGCTPREFRTALTEGEAGRGEADAVRLVFPTWLAAL